MKQKKKTRSPSKQVGTSVASPLVRADSTCLTPGPVEPRQAATGKGAQSVQAAGAVHAGVGVALINVDLTQATAVAVGTLAPGGRRRAMGRKVGDGFMEEVVATETVSRASGLPEIIDCVEAGASVQTGGAVTLVDVDVAVVA